MPDATLTVGRVAGPDRAATVQSIPGDAIRLEGVVALIRTLTFDDGDYDPAEGVVLAAEDFGVNELTAVLVVGQSNGAFDISYDYVTSALFVHPPFAPGGTEDMDFTVLDGLVITVLVLGR